MVKIWYESKIENMKIINKLVHRAEILDYVEMRKGKIDKDTAHTADDQQMSR